MTEKSQNTPSSPAVARIGVRLLLVAGLGQVLLSAGLYRVAVGSLQSTTLHRDIVELKYRRLRLDWNRLTVTSPLAKLFQEHQNNCTLTVNSFKFRNRYGFGSDLHVWTQAMCNAVQNNVRIFTELPWIFRDEDACAPATTTNASNDAATLPPTLHSAMGCYFPHAEPRCPNDADDVKRENTSFVKLSASQKGCSTVQEQYGASLSDIRAGGIEYLFSGISSIVVDEAHRQLNALFNGTSGPVLPDDTLARSARSSNSNSSSSSSSSSPRRPAVLVTVQIRWGDKKAEARPRPMSEYVDAVHALLQQRNISDPTTVGIYLATEDPSAVDQFRIEAEKYQWSVFVDMYYQEFSLVRDGGYNGNPRMAVGLRGRPGLVALASVLVALQADAYVLTTTSNWGRLMNELRKNVLDPRCGNCTRMVDLDPGEW